MRLGRGGKSIRASTYITHSCGLLDVANGTTEQGNLVCRNEDRLGEGDGCHAEELELQVVEGCFDIFLPPKLFMTTMLSS